MNRLFQLTTWVEVDLGRPCSTMDAKAAVSKFLYMANHGDGIFIARPGDRLPLEFKGAVPNPSLRLVAEVQS